MERAVNKGQRYYIRPASGAGVAVFMLAYVLLPPAIRDWVIAGTLFSFMCLVMTVNFFGARRKAKRLTPPSDSERRPS